MNESDRLHPVCPTVNGCCNSCSSCCIYTTVVFTSCVLLLLLLLLLLILLQVMYYVLAFVTAVEVVVAFEVVISASQRRVHLRPDTRRSGNKTLLKWKKEEVPKCERRDEHSHWFGVQVEFTLTGRVTVQLFTVVLLDGHTLTKKVFHSTWVTSSSKTGHGTECQGQILVLPSTFNKGSTVKRLFKSILGKGEILSEILIIRFTRH